MMGAMLKSSFHFFRSLLRLFKSLDAVIILFILLLFTSGSVIYIVNTPISPSFYIDNLSFKLGEKRSIELYVRVNRGNVELKQFFVNNESVKSWSADKRVVRNGESSKCVLVYPWRMGEYYNVKLVITDDRTAEVVAKSPGVIPSLEVEIKGADTILSLGKLKTNVTYWACTNGTDSLHLLLFTYASIQRLNRHVYIFYDSRYMADESVKRADAIISYFDAYNVSVEKIDYDALEKMTNVMPRGLLILINPLKDYRGNRVENAAPSSLMDPNGNGYIKDDSRYGRSHLYDWMRDNGLILVTVGSLQPHKRIIDRNGVYCHAKDSFDLFDTHLFLTEASGKRSIINGTFVLGNYTPVRISSSLGLFYREASFGFDKDSMEGYGLQYYAYGDYNLRYGESMLNLTLPVFIRAGEGGWLAMGDEEFWLRDEQLAHDLFMIYVQAVWDSSWVPYGWYWDSGCTFYSDYGAIVVEGQLKTEFIPLNIVGDRLIIRVVGVAYSSELGRGMMLEQTMLYKTR